MKFFQGKFKIFLPIILLLGILTSYKLYSGDEKRKVILELTLQSLNTAHFQPQTLNDAFSGKVFDLYLKKLDGSKIFLLQSDVDELKKYRNSIDDQVKNGTFEFLDASVDIVTKRIGEAEGYYREILKKPFDFSKDETYETDSKKSKFASGTREIMDSWRKYLKYQTLIRLDEMMQMQEKAKQKSDTAKTKQKSDTVKVKTFEQMEEEARGKVMKSYVDVFKRIKEIDKNDRLSDYMNAIANSYDPHTEYFLPKEKERFDITMTGQLEGIGAQLQEKDGFVKVANIVVGSASYRQGKLKAGDVILKVAQGAQDPVDVTDMRLDDVVSLIRGKKGTEVRLTTKKADGSIIVIPIIRDIVVIEETYAHSAVIDGKQRIGYIRLPIFYAPNKIGGRSSADDVKKELIKLKGEKISGLVLDLRDNGGGSLQDVVDMVGLFIDKGPVVQVKAKSDIAQLDDKESGTYYEGPLAVMVNSNSASASEILAAAIQDYKRGVIVGTNSTFGKGTVQRFFNLDDYLNPAFNNLKPMGSIKITTQKFYRVNGGATQLKGVIPDIVLPDPFSYIETGEKDQDYPMQWDVIPPAKINPWPSPVDMDKLKKNSKSRVQANPNFNLVNELALKWKKQKDETSVSLNLQKYREEQAKNREDSKKYDAITKEVPDFGFSVLKDDESEVNSDTSKVAKNKDWFKSLKKDIYLNEAAAILKDVQN